MPRPLELSPASSFGVVDVIVGIVADADGRVLVAERPDGKHMAGSWEFPGGKLEPRESPLRGLIRELDEELGIRVRAAEPFIGLSHRYPDRTVKLDVWWVTEYDGAVHAREGQVLRWIEPDALAALPILPADRPIVAAIRERLATASTQG